MWLVIEKRNNRQLRPSDLVEVVDQGQVAEAIEIAQASSELLTENY